MCYKYQTMGIEYYIDKSNRCVFTRLCGVVSIDDFVAHQRKLALDKDFDPTGYELIDTTPGTPGEGIGFRSFSQIAQTSPWKGNAHRAIVTSSNALYGLANVFKMIMSKEHGEIAIFKTNKVALAWLGIEPPENPHNIPSLLS